MKSFMISSFLFCLLMILLLSFSPSAAGEEGMWLLNKLDKVPSEYWQRLSLKPENLFDPQDKTGSHWTEAILLLGGGTASFVSKDGLILTNHHVAFDAVQKSSNLNQNFLEDGFYASSFEQEIPAKGYEALIVREIVDVTERIQNMLTPTMGDKERFDTMEKEAKKITAEAEAKLGKENFKCEVKGFFGGREYYLFQYYRLKDIRIVYFPPKSIGNFGGETDNWMWPRHTGDFAFLRAYLDNKPYHPRKYLKISKAPLQEDDPTLVLGFPGTTNKYESSFSVQFTLNSVCKILVPHFANLIAVMEKEGEQNPSAEIKLASTVKSLKNSYKFFKSVEIGLNKYDVVQKKQALEERILEACKTEEEKANFQKALLGIEAAYAENSRIYTKSLLLSRILGSVRLLGTAYTIYKWNLEQAKPKDEDREMGYMAKNEEEILKRLALWDETYDPKADPAILKFLLAEALRLKASIACIEEIKNIEEFVTSLYATTQIVQDKNKREEMFKMGLEKLMQMQDKAILFISALEKEQREITDIAKRIQGSLSSLHPKYLQYLQDSKVMDITSPDANRTLRLSIGVVKGCENPADGKIYKPFTTLSGIFEKAWEHKGNPDFVIPEKLQRVYRCGQNLETFCEKKLADVPVCFLTTNDTAGGNSGSPVLNRHGHLIGVLFDGMYEGLASRWSFQSAIARAIHVHSHYILFNLAKVQQADRILAELELVSE